MALKRYPWSLLVGQKKYYLSIPISDITKASVKASTATLPPPFVNNSGSALSYVDFKTYYDNYQSRSYFSGVNGNVLSIKDGNLVQVKFGCHLADDKLKELIDHLKDYNTSNLKVHYSTYGSLDRIDEIQPSSAYVSGTMWYPLSDAQLTRFSKKIEEFEKIKKEYQAYKRERIANEKVIASERTADASTEEVARALKLLKKNGLKVVTVSETR